MTIVNKEVTLQALSTGHTMIVNKIADLEMNNELHMDVERLLYQNLQDFEEQLNYASTTLNYEDTQAVLNVFTITNQILSGTMRLERAVKSGKFTSEVGPYDVE